MALPQDETTTEQPSIDYEALGLEPVTFGSSIPQPAASQPEIDYEGLGLEPVQYGISIPKKEPEGPSDWDTLRGLEVSMRQVPQLAYGVAGLVGATSEQITGYGEALRDWGFRGYKDWEQSIEPVAKETDDITVAWNKAKEGDIGALVDWAQYGIGYALGQLGETAAVSALGALAGGAAAAPAGPEVAIPAAVGGGVIAAAGKTGFKALATNLVEKAIAKQALKIAEEQAAKQGVKLTAEQLAKQAESQAVKKLAGKEIGSNAAIFANSIGMELGGIYGEAESQARAEGRELTGVDLARIWGTGLAAGGLEGFTDKVGLDLLKGKLSARLPAGRLAGAAVAGGIGILGEAATETLQTGLERAGAGKDVLSDDAVNEYINAAALGGLGGGVIGGAGGFIAGNPKENAAAKAKVAAEASKSIAPETANEVAKQADAVIQEVAQETPDQRVARLQQEAKAAAGITLEEEAPVAGLPPTPEVAQTAQARITEREGQTATPVETPAGTRIEAAAYQAPDGTVYYGASHLDAMAKARDAGKIDQAIIDAKQETTSRETPEFGFATNADPFVTRDQAETIARQSGQITVEQPATGKLHSNEVSLDAFAQPVAPEAAPAAVEPTPVAQPPVTPQLEPLRRVARAEQTEEDVAGLVDGGLVEVYKGQPVLTQAGLEALPEAERPRLTPEARKIQIDTRTSEAVAEAISKNLRIGVDQVPVDVRMPAGWMLEGDVYVPPQPQVIAPAPTPEVREARREPPVEIQQQYAPKTEEEQQSFDRASTNKILARSPQLAVAAVRLKNGEITAGEYADLVDVLDPFVVKGAEPVPTNEKIYQYMSQTAGGKPTSEQGKEKLSKIGVFKKDGTQRIPNGKLAEFRIDIPTYNESTKNGDTVYSITGHEPVSETATQVGKTIAHLGIAKITNPQFITRTISGKGDAIQIAMGAGKFPLATVKGNYEAITELPADINDPNVWTETGYNPVRSSELVDVRSKKALVGGTEAIMVGSRVFVKNAQLEARPTGITMGERYARRVQMGRAGMEPSAVEARLQELGFPTGGIIRVVNQPDADFEGRTIILDGKVTGIELNAAALKDNAAIDRVLNHEFAESANADGALNKLVERLTPKEKKEINDTITRLRYEERARTSEEAARAIETLAEAWKGRGFFTRAVARVEAWASKLGFKLTRRAAEYIAARNLADINAGFRAAYNRFINVKGEAREGRAFVTPEENARFLELAKDPEANREELQKMVDEAAKKAGYNIGPLYHGTRSKEFSIFESLRNGLLFFTTDKGFAEGYAEDSAVGTGTPRIVSIYASVKNPWDYKNKKHVSRLIKELEKEGILEDPRELSRGGYRYASQEDIIQDIKEGYWSALENEQIVGLIESLGYDGIWMTEGGDITRNLAVFSPEQVKSTEPVTRNGLGDVIPLENRFQPTKPDIRYARREVRESRREPEAIPTFTEGTPEAATLKEMATSMAKVDAASEAKGGKPETQKISDIAANWMDQGGDERALQDAIVENTNLTPANAARVAKAIARQYDIQQSIATAFLETQTGLSVEALPEGVTLPKEVDPDRPKPVMQRLFEVFMGVRVPPVKITGNEKTLLKQQIRLKAAANRAAKEAQKETAAAVIETIKQMELRGPVRPKQAQALAKRAANVIWTSEKSVEAFTEYAAKVVENTNYDADVREAKAAQKRAKELSKQKTVAMSPQRQVLEDIGKISIGSIDDPRLFADTVNYYLRAFKKVTSPDYVVIPDSEMTSYLSQLENQEIDTNAERERVSNEKLAAQYGLPLSQVEALLNSQDIIRDLVAYAKREQIESILNQKIGDIQTALKAYDQNQLRPDQRKLVDSLLAIDANGLDAKEKQSLIRIGNNVIYNNQTNGAQYFVAVANGQQNARQAAQDFKTIEKNRAWIDLIPTLGSKRVAETMRNWSLELQSVADTFRNIFGKESMAKIFRQMGMYNLDRGFTDAANVLDQIQEKMAEFYKKNTKKYGKAARDQNGILSEGVVGFLIQQVPAKGEAESIAQRRDLIKQDIANRRSSRQADKIEMANRIEEILGKVDGNTVEEILANMKANYRPNYDSLTYLMNDLLPQYKDFLKQFDENFNDQANNYDNPYYLPIAFIRSGPELEITPESESMFYAGMSLRPKQAANTIKRVDYSVLPKDKSGNPKEIQFNLRRGTYDSLSDQINKAYTNEAWQQIFSFMKTADADAVFGGRANKDFMAERLNRLRISRMRRGSANNGAIAKFADSISVLARKIGTGIALGGVFQVFKQSPDQLISALGTTGRYDLLGEHVMTIRSAKKLLDKFSIGRRGDASSGYKYINQMEGAQNRLERAFTESRWSEVKENASKVADVWMLALKKTDFLCAASAWMTYYRANLDKNGIKFEGWDKEAQLVDTDTARQDAASYAEQMTDIYQGSSDPTKMATFAQSGKSGWENFVKAALVPFNSFAVQQRMRIYSDGRDSFTKAGETGALGRFGLASTIGGLVAFHTMRRLVLPTITGAGVYALYAMLGVDMDEPDEEKKKEEARKTWRQFQGELLANTLVGGAPQFVEAATIDAFNYANYLVSLQLESEDIIDDNGEIMDFAKYQKERSPFWRYQSFKNAPSFGMFDVGFGQAEKVAVQTKQLMDREQMEMYTPEEQRLLYFSTLSEWLYLMRLNDADFARMVGKARRDMIKAVEDREKQIKAIREGR